ncbi:MAG: asparaginase [Acholeplasmataceae bacterium]|nr:asparaginase [Acholeplasmataceae bacterium]
MKKILIVFTGGTISMTSFGESSKSDILDNHDELIKIIEPKFSNTKLEGFVYSMVPSPSLTPNDMLKIGSLIDSKLENENFDGVVITHGTDTLEETAYFLDLYLDTKKPVVLTGSLRNFDELGYDGYSNLLSAILVSLSDKSYGRGVLVCLNDEINSAVEVTKTHTFALDTFKSLEFGPLGLVDENNVIYYRDASYQSDYIRPKSLNKKVEILKLSSGSDPKILDYYLENVDGLVLEGFGRGNVSEVFIPGIKKLIEKGITVIITSRCPMGRIRDTYSYLGGGHHLKRLGVLGGGSLPSHKVRIKLLLILSSGLNPKDYFTYEY